MLPLPHSRRSPAARIADLGSPNSSAPLLKPNPCARPSCPRPTLPRGPVFATPTSQRPHQGIPGLRGTAYMRRIPYLFSAPSHRRRTCDAFPTNVHNIHHRASRKSSLKPKSHRSCGSFPLGGFPDETLLRLLTTAWPSSPNKEPRPWPTNRNPPSPGAPAPPSLAPGSTKSATTWLPASVSLCNRAACALSSSTAWCADAGATLLSPVPTPRDAQGKGYCSLRSCWCAVCADVKLGNPRLRDLRRTAASQAVMLGGNLPLVGELPGHRRHRTTASYAHLADSHLVGATKRVGAIIAAAMET